MSFNPEKKAENRQVTKLIMKYGKRKNAKRKDMERPRIYITEEEVYYRDISAEEKRTIEAGNFFKGLCRGMSQPSQYVEK